MKKILLVAAVLLVVQSSQAVQLAANIGSATNLMVSDVAAVQQSDLAAHKELLKDFRDIGEQITQLQSPSIATAAGEITLAAAIGVLVALLEMPAYAAILRNVDIAALDNPGLEGTLAGVLDFASCVSKAVAMNMGDLPAITDREFKWDMLALSMVKGFGLRLTGVGLAAYLKEVCEASSQVQACARIGVEIISLALDCLLIAHINTNRLNNVKKREELEVVRARVQNMMEAVQARLHTQALQPPARA